jgi:hypothetical protein
MSYRYNARPTRFPGLGYANVRGCGWIFVDMSDGDEAQIGAWYPTRTELLADLVRFAEERGYRLAS